MGRGDARERASFSPQAETEPSGLCGDEVSRATSPAVRGDGCVPNAEKAAAGELGNPTAPRAAGRGRATEQCEVSPFGGTERSEVCEDDMPHERISLHIRAGGSRPPCGKQPARCSGGARQGFGNAYVCRRSKRRRMSPLLLNWASGQRTACTKPARYPVSRVYVLPRAHEPGGACETRFRFKSHQKATNALAASTRALRSSEVEGSQNVPPSMLGTAPTRGPA